MKSFLKYTLATILGIFVSTIIFILLSLGILGMWVSSSEKPVEVLPHTILHYTLTANVPERTPSFPYTTSDLFSFNLVPVPGLNDILNNIKKAASDQNIDGIYIETGMGTPGLATLEEMRGALQEFKKSGKFVITYAPEVLPQAAYYLATVSDSIFINPAGVMQLTGMRAEITYYKEALQKLGVEVQVIKHGKFKSAVEPFTRNDMSEENRQQLSVYMKTVWGSILDTIAEARGVSRESLNRMADHLEVNSPQAAVQLSLVDGLRYKDEVLTLLGNLTNRGEKDPRMVSMAKYTTVPGRSRKGYTRNKIAIIYGEGDIVSGSGNETNIGGDHYAEALRKARKDTTVKAIVLRVNSPGGGTMASEIIWREVMLAQQVKPVVASMGNYAASGGYYILCPATKIVAQPLTLTGSIGVFGLIPNADKLLQQKIGLHFDVEKTNRYADFGSFYRPLSPGEKNFLTHQIENTYATFVEHVSTGRKLSKSFVDSIGQGRIWSAISAKDLGLVDQLGGIDDAITLAAKLAGLTNYRIVALPRLENPYEKLLKQLGGDIQAVVYSRQLKNLGIDVNFLSTLKNREPLQMRLPFGLTVY